MRNQPSPQHVCVVCGAQFPESAHPLRRYCYTCKEIQRKTNAVRLMRAWRARHPDYWRKYHLQREHDQPG